MFKNTYYDPKKNEIHHWFLDENGKTKHDVSDYKHEYYSYSYDRDHDAEDIYGNFVKRNECSRKRDLTDLKKSGVKFCESDMDECVKYLHSRYGDQEDTIDFTKYKSAIVDIEIAVEDEFPKPELAKYPINLITMVDPKTGATYTFGNQEYTGSSELVKNFHYCSDEVLMLERFLTFFRKQKIDIWTGWYSDNFDLLYIVNRCELLGVDYTKLSPIGIVNVSKNRDKVKNVAGLAILDYQKLYKKFVVKNHPSYSLQYISMYELQEGKLDYEGTIKDFYKTDWNRFVEYNIQDCLLVKKLDEKKKFIDLTINLCVQTRTPFEKVFSSIAVIEGYIIRYLHRKNMVMSDRTIEISDDDEEETIEGGYVEAHPGFYKYLLSFDVESLYPHMIMMFNISPETKILNPREEDIPNLIKSPVDGVYYRKDKKGLIAEVVEKIFKERKMFKEMMFEEFEKGDKEKSAYYDSQQQIRKTIIVSIYGVMLSKFFHFYDLDNGSTITTGGRNLITMTSSSANEYFNKVFPKVAKKTYPNSILKIGDTGERIVPLIDTDSNFIRIDILYDKLRTGKEFVDFALELEEKILDPFFERVINIYCEEYNIPNLINFKREKVVLKMFIQTKKKYASLCVMNEKKIYKVPELDIKGLEIKKSDLPKFCQDGLYKIVECMMEGDSPDRETMLSLVRKYQKEHKQIRIEDISIPKSISSYKDYSIPIKKGKEMVSVPLKYKPKTPMQHRAGINYNYIIKKLSLPFMEVDDGARIKYVFVAPNNIVMNDVVAYIGNYPKEFEELFKIDRDGLFEKTFLNQVNRIFHVLGFGQIPLKQTKMNKFFEE